MSQIFSLTLTKPSCIFYLFWIICCADIIPVLLNWGCASACSTMFSVFVLRTYKIYTYTNTIYKFWHFSWFLFYSCVIKWTAAFPIWLHSSGCRERQQTTTWKHLNNIQSIASLRCTIITQYYKEKKKYCCTTGFALVQHYWHQFVQLVLDSEKNFTNSVVQWRCHLWDLQLLWRASCHLQQEGVWHLLPEK